MVWLRFAAVQLVMLLATILGWIVLVPFALARAWEPCPSRFDPSRVIDRWKWKPLNAVYGNPEDGVSGMKALVWTNGVQGPYMPGAWPAWRAYLWSAWRNSADNLKYVFACSSCPIKQGTILGKPYKLGWQFENGIKVPVLSFG